MGLHISVYKFPLGDATGGGLTSNHSELTLVNVDGPFEPSEKAPPALLQMHVAGCLRIVPAGHFNGEWKPLGSWHMMGGNFGHTSDSRFTEACEKLLGHRFYGAVAIHDRKE